MVESDVVYHLCSWKNRWAHCLDKMITRAKFGTDELRLEIVLTVCTTRSHLRKYCRKTVIKDGFEEIEHELSFSTFRPGTFPYAQFPS